MLSSPPKAVMAVDIESHFEVYKKLEIDNELASSDGGQLGLQHSIQWT